MKKLIGVLVFFVLLTSCASAELDIKQLSYDELIELRQQITEEIISRPEWKEVFVPAGVYEVGVDIPAGRWTLSLADTDYFGYSYGSVLNETKTDIDMFASDNYAYDYGTTEESVLHESFPQESVSVEIQEGSFIVIEGNCYFTPYIRPALGF